MLACWSTALYVLGGLALYIVGGLALMFAVLVWLFCIPAKPHG